MVAQSTVHARSVKQPSVASRTFVIESMLSQSSVELLHCGGNGTNSDGETIKN